MTITSSRPQVQNLQTSLIRKLANKAMGREGVIPLWFGEPDVPTPDFIRDSAKSAIDDGQTFYQPNLGITPLREAIATYMNNLYHTTFEVDNIAVASSGMSALSLAMQCVVAEGDSVIVPSPVWPNLPSVAEILGAKIISVPLRPIDNRWQLDIGELFDSVQPDTRALLINSPNNPTGWMLTDDEQQTILDFCRERDVWLIADEVYSRIVYDRKFAPTFADKITEDDKLIIINSFSKSWAMTGWRLGWLTVPKSLIATLEMLVEFNFSCIFAPIQVAGITALQHGEEFITHSMTRYQSARDRIISDFADLPRVKLPEPEAAFYAFFAVEGITDSFALAEKILLEAGVGLAPGIAFGQDGEGYLRLCYATDLTTLDKALSAMRPLLK